jgi:hypothetical protein
MITPGFNAEASLYRAKGCYGAAASVMQITGALYPAQLAASGCVDTCVNVTCPSICALPPIRSDASYGAQGVVLSSARGLTRIWNSAFRSGSWFDG